MILYDYIVKCGGNVMCYLSINEIEKYRRYLQEEERSLATVGKYIRDIYNFFDFIGDKQKLNKEVVIQYKQSLGEKYKASSINSMLVAVNGFLEFIGMNDCKVKLHKIQKRIFIDNNKKLTQEEYKRLLKASSQNEKLNILLQTICATGIRVSEHKYITVEAIKKGNATIINKGKVREILIPKVLRQLLLRYCEKSQISTGPIFITRNKKPINRSNIWSMMKKLCNDANVDPAKVYPHNLRHLFAFTFYKVEKNLAYLADVLGHSSIETTRIYTKTSIQECQSTLDRIGLVEVYNC